MSLLSSMGLFLLLSQSPEDWKACDEALFQASAKKKVMAVLKAMSKACAQATPALADTAGNAAKLPRAQRVARLLEGAQPLLPATCKVTGAFDRASEVGPECQPLEVSEALKHNLDAGTYLFVLALQRERGKHGPGGEVFQAALRRLLLSAALENERYKP